jgi:hypothetical protein
MVAALSHGDELAAPEIRADSRCLRIAVMFHNGASAVNLGPSEQDAPGTSFPLAAGRLL